MIRPGSVIGIIGGGQLGRMMAVAAAELGYRVHIFEREHGAPASHVSYRSTTADYSDAAALKQFAANVDVITFEFENIPFESLELLESLKPVHPSARVLKISRNRIREKSFVNDLGIATAPFCGVSSLAELQAAVKEIGIPAILKTTELGYDGKGQLAVGSDSDLPALWHALNTKEAILEGFVDFRMEISVLVARGADGKALTYVPVQNFHKNHMLDITVAPAAMDKQLAQEAETIAVRIATALNLQGLLAVEMFVTKDNRVLVNELAPRPHNSGHWTMDACVTGQFEQAIRAVCGLPLGSTERLCDAKMKNLIGDDVKDAGRYFEDKNAKVHLYGKHEIRPGRKMGHVTTLRKSS